MSEFVLVCDIQPADGQECPPEFARWVPYVSGQVHLESFVPTQQEFYSAMPWIISMLFLAWGFRLIVKQILNR